MTEEKNNSAACPCEAGDAGVSRRSVLAANLVLAAGLATAGMPGEALAEDNPALLPPQDGDVLVHATGDRKGEPVTLADFTTEEPLIQAWAKDPASDTVRSKSRLNRVMLIKLDPATLNEQTLARSAKGVVAYSDFCTHAGCWIENYRPQEGVIFCHCHSSMFDPKDNAKVVGGPAKAPLAGLPIKEVDSHFLVSGPFEGKVGIPKVA